MCVPWRPGVERDVVVDESAAGCVAERGADHDVDVIHRFGSERCVVVAAVVEEVGVEAVEVLRSQVVESVMPDCWDDVVRDEPFVASCC